MCFIWCLFLVLAIGANAKNESDWEACKDLPVLGHSCIEIYVVEANLTIGIRLIVQNHTILDEHFTGTDICLDDQTLLKLIELIPPLAPFKKIIDMLIRLHGFIPGEVFSICLKIEDLKTSKTEIDGCVFMDYTLMCWEKKCLAKGEEKFGCFHIPTNE